MRQLTLLACSLFLLGCANTPGALQMKLQPEEARIAPDQALALQATLVGVGSDVVLARNYGFAVEIRSAAGPVYVADPAEAPPAPEGAHGVLVNGPLAVADTVVNLAALSDSANLLDRYRVLHPGETATHRLDLAFLAPPDRAPAVKLAQEGKPGAAVVKQLPAAWPPGEYWVVVRLVNRDLASRAPAPLFWTPYDQPVESRAHVVVQAR